MIYLDIHVVVWLYAGLIEKLSEYFEFFSALKDPGHEEHKSYREWYGGFPWYNGVFDSEAFDMEQVNLELLKYLRYSRDRFKPWEGR